MAEPRPASPGPSRHITYSPQVLAPQSIRLCVYSDAERASDAERKKRRSLLSSERQHNPEERKPLRHGLRNQILAEIQANPGINQRTLSGRVRVHPTTVGYHCRALEADGLVSTRRLGRELNFFSSADPGGARRDVAGALRQVAKRRIVWAFQENPGSSISDAARLLACHPSTAKRHVDDLIAKKILLELPRSRCRRLMINPEFTSTIQAHIAIGNGQDTVAHDWQ